MRIVLLGKPGSGKGTLAALLSSSLGLPHLSSGEILRQAIRERTPLGLEVENHVLRGEIGPEDLIASAVLDHIDRIGLGDGHVLDGFPRTILQAEMLDRRFPPDLCVLIEVADRTVVERIGGRLCCAGCGAVYHSRSSPPLCRDRCDSCGGGLSAREDDSEEAVRRRIEVFARQVIPVIDHYEARGGLQSFDGEKPPERVFEEVRKAISSRSW